MNQPMDPELHVIKVLDTKHGQLTVHLKGKLSETRIDGSVSSTLPRRGHIDPAIDAVEALVLAHACNYIRVDRVNYMEGVEKALDAILDRAGTTVPIEAELLQKIRDRLHERSAMAAQIAHGEEGEDADDLIEELDKILQK